MIIIGVTGGYAAGKSAVTSFFRELGANVIDADKIAHRIIRRNSPGFREIVLSFGKDILAKNKSIDRRKLGLKVFGNEKALKILCRITHPFIIAKIKKKLDQIEKANPESVVIIDAPLLIEARLDKIVDWLLVVDTTPANMLRRGAARTGIAKCEVERRIKAQVSLKSKKKLADYVIDNNRSLLQTKKQVKIIWKKIVGAGLASAR